MNRARGPLPELLLSGQGGTATVRLTRLCDGTYTVSQIVCNFAPAPVPEPATLFPLGTGLSGAGAAAARRRRLSRRPDKQ